MKDLTFTESKPLIPFQILNFSKDLTYALVLVAGGVGKRMGSSTPKQYLNLQGVPVFVHSIKRFITAVPNISVVMVVSPEMVDFAQELALKHIPDIHITWVLGGKERFHSVKNGIAACEADIIAIHDAVRPLVTTATIAQCLHGASERGAAIPVIEISESLRRKTSHGSETVDRANMVAVQTPQCFKNSILEEAFTQEYHLQFTDDASVVEQAGFPVYLCDGNRENIKITRPEDLQYAELILAR